MPAVSVCDPVQAALRLSFEVAQSKTSEDISVSLTSGASRILQTEIQYEQVDDYQSTVLEQLKAKYTVLSLSSSSSSSTNHIDNENGKNKDNNFRKKNVTGPTLPEPTRTLYSPSKVSLGWKEKVPIGAGMFNVGNTCYLNSTLQALFHVPALVNWLLSDPHHNSKCEQNGTGECLTCAMAKTLQVSHEKSGQAIKPFHIYNKLKSICRTMVPGQQEDAHEFLRYLLEGMERAYLIRHKATKLDNYSKETTPINQIFGGYIRTEVKCLQCSHVSTTFQHFQDLLVDIRKANTLDEALTSYFSREQLDNNDYKCEACKRRVPATKQFSLERPPKVLCVQLKRFSVLGGKIARHIGFKEIIDMGPYLWRETGESPKKLNYKLTSMVTHMGSSINCGHYTAIAQVSSGQYYLFDDSYVRSIGIQNVLNNNAYIMIFEMEPQSLNQLSNHQINKLNGISNIKPNGLNKSMSPKPSTSGINYLTNGKSINTISNGTLNKHHDTQSPIKIRSSSPSLKLSHQNVHSQKSTNFIGPQLPQKLIEKTQPRLITHSKSDKSFNNNSLVPYDGSSEEDETLTNNSNNPYSSNNSSFNGSLNTSKENNNSNNHENNSSNNNNNSSSSSNNYNSNSNKDSFKANSKSELKTLKPISQREKLNGSSNNGTTTPLKYQNGKSENGKDKYQFSRIKSSNLLEEKIQTKASNGWDSKEKVESTSNGWSVTENKEESKSKFNPVNSAPSAAAPRSFNGTNRSDAVSHLLKQSHRGYGSSSVTNWDGNRTHLDREVDNERREERKRHFNPDDDMDRGRIKKIKSHREYDGRSNPGYNPFQEHQNIKSWNRSNNIYNDYNNHRSKKRKCNYNHKYNNKNKFYHPHDRRRYNNNR